MALFLALVPGTAPAQGLLPEWRPSPPVILGPADRFPTPAFGGDGRVLISPVAPREIDMLRPDDSDSTGALESGQGGFGITLWQGTPRSLVERLVSDLPVRAPSPVMHDLARRLLLTTANAPEGGIARGLTALRLTKLAELSGPADVDALFGAAATAEEPAVRAWVDARLLGGEPDCPRLADITRSLIGSFPGSFWRKLDVYCRVRAGDTAGAALAADVLRDQNPDDGGGKDEAFFALVDLLTGNADAGTHPIRSLPQPTPLHLAMMRLAGLPLPADALPAATTPALLAAIARGALIDPAMRLAATERAAAIGALRAEAVADAYDAAPFKPTDIAAAGTLTDATPRNRALVHRAAAATDPARRLPLLALHLSLLDPALAVGPVGAVPLIRAIDSLTPGPAASPLAVPAARAYYAQGRPEEASRWHQLALDSGGETARAALRLWPLAALAGGAAEPKPPGEAAEPMPPGGAALGGLGLAAWLDAVTKGADPKDRDRVAGLLALLEATGEPVGEEAWMRVLGSPNPAPVAMPSPTLWVRLRDSAAGNRIGEVVLVALSILGDGGPQAAPPLVVAQIVASLRAVGLDAEARALAREAAVALVW